MAVGTTGRLLAGRYRTIRRLGAGGMATVYLAEDERLGRRVAVKRLHGDMADEDLARRFHREARLGASLNHPNVVTVYDIVPDDEGVLIVMEYVEGHTLRDEIAGGAVAPDRAMPVLAAVAEALDHAHEHGVVHRDVKPANVLVRRDGTAKLADLGIATAAEQSRITRSGSVLGTAAYMAPERLDGGAGDRSADVYALAAVAFEALSGRKAVEGTTPLEVAQRVVTGPPPDLTDALPDAPPGAAAVLRRGLAKDPAERPRSARDLVERLAGAFHVSADPEPVATAVTTPLAAEAEARPLAEPEGELAPAPGPPTPTPAVVLPPVAEPRAAQPPAPGRRAAEPRAAEPPAAAPPSAPPPRAVARRERGRRGPLLALTAIALALLAGGLIALTSGGSDQKASSSSSSSAAKAAKRAKRAKAARKAEAAAATPGGSSSGSGSAAGAATPTGAVTTFYQRAAAHDYAGAWQLATPSLRNQLAGYRSFAASQSTLRSIRFPVMRTTSQSASAATVELQSEAQHVSRVDHVCGTVSLVHSGGGWLLDRLNLDTCGAGAPGAAAAGPPAGKPGKGPKPGKGFKNGNGHGKGGGGD